jgi:hypothetical protein
MKELKEEKIKTEKSIEEEPKKKIEKEHDKKSEKNDFWGKLGNFVKKSVDCCLE